MSLIEDRGILLSIAKYSGRCQRVILFSENNGIVQTFLKLSRNQIPCQVYDLLDFSCNYLDSYNYRDLEIAVLRSYLKNVFGNRPFIAVLNSAVAIVLSLRERGNIRNLYRLFQNLLSLSEFDHVNPLPYYIDFLLNVLAFFGTNLGNGRFFSGRADESAYYLSPRTGNCVSQEAGEKYKHKLFVIPESFSSYSENVEDISRAIDILHYFLRRVLSENPRGQEDRMVEVFREILLEEVRRQDFRNVGNPWAVV
ncbi:MAG: hypothetical protein LBU15_02895 [Rickettsiales bacterium]|jgi:recombinational DNA repair protein (RecF pathway)|nr:hypothetical protein [Rickettsiales bacterium]